MNVISIDLCDSGHSQKGIIVDYAFVLVVWIGFVL